MGSSRPAGAFTPGRGPDLTASEPALVHVDAADYPLVASPYVTGAGTDWAQADKTANGTVDGHTHANALHRLTDLRLALLRFPDGEFSNCFDWRSSVGPQAGRPKMLINWDPAGSNNHPCYPLQRDVFGTGEFLAETAQLTALAGRKVEPLITVNVCTVTAGRNCGSGGYPDLCPDPLHDSNGGCPGAALAAGWVEYLNGAAGSHYGAMRAADGHPAAYGVSYFEIGNETPISETPERPYYSQVLNAYAGAMRAVDPTIRIVAQGDCGCSGRYEAALSPGADDISALSTVVPLSGFAPAGSASMSIIVPRRSVSVLSSELAVAP